MTGRSSTLPTLGELRDDFERAARTSGGAVALHLTVARRPVSIQFAAAAAAGSLRRAFAHLETPKHSRPALTLYVWDAATGGAQAPPLARGHGADAEAVTTGTGPSYYYERRGFRALHQPASNALSVLNAEADTGWFWAGDLSALPYWDYTAPFRHLVSWWLDRQGLRHVHGGAVGTPSGGLLLVGSGGSGKSTTALASLLDDRLRYAGDDYVAVGTGPSVRVHSLYCCGKFLPADVHRLPHLAEAVVDGRQPDEKAVIYVETAFPGRCIADFPLRAIVLPRVTDRAAARARPATPAAALAALAPSTIFQLHPPAREALSQLAELVRTVPTFVLELGSEVETIPLELMRLLDQVA